MHIVFAALNAKFIHTSLALACLGQACRNSHRDLSVCEYTINEQHDKVLADLFSQQPDILCFSCYIWNIEEVLQICQDYKQVCPACLIILGGPEVSYDAADVLNDCQAVDIVVQGEGEATLPELLTAIEQGQSLDTILGIAFRNQGKVKENAPRQVLVSLDELQRPAYETISPLKGRTLYYETSRGCPFNCSFCLSSADKSLRTRSLENVKSDLKYLMDQGAGEIKFVDRTFNVDEARALRIMDFILEQGGDSVFHFEIRAELLSDSFIKFLGKVPPGKFNFEIGVQSTCPESLRTVKRPPDWDKARINIARLCKETSIHIHLDLIAGLPYEDYQRFQVSFNDVLALRPHMLQMGFLKMLKGTPLRSAADQYGYVFQAHPPYQILASNFISYNQLIMLQNVEDLLQQYYNSGAFHRIFNYINDRIYSNNGFAFFEEFSLFWRKQGLFDRAHKRERGYAYLLDFIGLYHLAHRARAEQIIMIDYLFNQGPQRISYDLPDCSSNTNKEILYGWLNDLDFVMTHIPELQHLKPGERRRRVHLEYLSVDPQSLQDYDQAIPVIFVYPPGSRQANKIVSLGP